MRNYFKKFSIMFVMLLAIVGVGAIQSGTIANAITIGQQSFQPESGWNRTDDASSAIEYTNFKFISMSNMYNGTEHYFINSITTDVSYIKFCLNGTKLRLITNIERTADTITYGEISFDGGVTFEKFTNGSNNGIRGYQYLTYEKTGLASGKHDVVIKYNKNDQPSGAFVFYVFDAIDTDGTIIPPVTKSITLDKSSMNLNVGADYQLTATTTPAAIGVTWTSSDSSIATVDSNGKVAAVKAGQATITATTTDGSNLSATCAVTVSENESITLDQSVMNLTEGNSGQLTATTTPASVGVTWTISDPSIATIEVDPTSGKIIKVNALKEGQAIITAITTDGSNLSASSTVNVTKKTEIIKPEEPTESGDIVNVAHAKGDNTKTASGDVPIIFKGLPDTNLSVVKTADVKSVYVGDTFTYTIVVTNTGSKTAKAVVINDSAPNHIDFTVGGITTTQGKVDPSSTSKNIIVNVGDIPPLGTVTIKIPATVIL